MENKVLSGKFKWSLVNNNPAFGVLCAEFSEPAIWKLRDMIAGLDYEQESILTELPSFKAIIEYRELWDTYKTEFRDGIIEAIEQGEDPGPYMAFVRRYKLNNWPKPKELPNDHA